MTEFNPGIASVSTELAWQAALASNDAFDRERELENATAGLHMAARLAIEGVTVDEAAYDALKARRALAQNDYEQLSAMAGLIMSAPDSPFVLPREQPSAEFSADPEEAETPSNPLVSREDLIRFGKENGYHFGVAPRAFKVLESVSTEDVIRVKNMANYTPQRGESSDGVRIVEFKAGKETQTYIDLRGLSIQARKWIDQPPQDILDLGPVTVNFLADFVSNHLESSHEEQLSVSPA